MKPRTKIEKAVDRMIPWVQPLTHEQQLCLMENAFAKDFNAYRHKDKVTCMHCGNTFRIEDGMKCCPYCGQRLEITESRKYTQRLAAYVCLSQQFNEDWQVFRYFRLNVFCKRGQMPDIRYDECWQKWLSSKGEYVLAALPRGMSFCYDNWRTSEPITIKRPYRNYYGNDYSEWVGYYTKIESVIPNLRRNGYDGDTFGIPAWDLFRGLLKRPIVETLFKAHQYELAKYLTLNDVTDDMIAAVKVANRNKYSIRNVSLWFDYIRMLSKLGLDVHNAHYVCPKNLNEAHDIALKRLNKKKEDERIRQERMNAAKYNDKYIKEHKKFFGLLLTNKNINIRPLMSVFDFLEEGERMHHCVYRMGYYKKPDHLILSAKDADGQRIETVDVNLKTYEIDQSYGLQNRITEHHDEILNLVNEHMGEIQALNSQATVKYAVAI